MSQPSEPHNRPLLTENVSSSGSLKGDAMPTPGSEKELVYGGDTSKATPLAKSAANTIVSTIIGGWVFAVIFAVAQHFFFVSMQDKLIPVYPSKKWYEFHPNSQDSIKTAATTFTRAVVLSLTVAAGGILTQMVWRIPRGHPVPLEHLDKIFKLPSPVSAATLLFSPMVRYLYLVLILVLCMQGLEAVTVLAPQALKINGNYTETRSAQVPSLDLSTGLAESADVYSQGYVHPSALWNRVVKKVVMFPTQTGLLPPEECTGGCQYTIEYDAPALKCRNLDSSQIRLKPYDSASNGTPQVYNGTSTLWGNPITNVSPDTAPASNPNPTLTDFPSDTNYTLRIEWLAFSEVPTDTGPVTQTPNGVECTFYDAKYSASIYFNGTRQAINTRVTQPNQVLHGVMANQDTSSCPPTPSPSSSCWVSGTNYRATAEAFAELFVGGITDDDSGPFTLWGNPELTPFFNISTVTTTDGVQKNFTLGVPDLGASLEGMFGNVTLALIASRTDLVNTDVMFFAAGNVWKYEAWLLWAIYIPTLVAFGAFALHGLWCIKQDGAVESSFLNFLVSTRGESLDRVVNDADTVDAMKGVAVTYAKQGTFEVVFTKGTA